jgi:alkanesulfonate monooxygenase SsuD/methylene tetrahydromethanopterin reductase-like flavin-dependent oxidoreductase (luciferase family)
MSWPLTLPFSEAQKYRDLLDSSIAAHDGPFTGRFAMMRHTAVYETEQDRALAIDAVRAILARFGNLMMKKGEVVNGFPEPVPLSELEGNVRVDPDMLEQNLMFGSPETVADKLRQYQGIGVDAFIYYASMGLDMDAQKRSLQLFIDKVMPRFSS